MLQVKQIINNVFKSNTYVVLDDDYDYCWLVDIGSYEKVKEAIPSGMEVRGVFLTHTHFDHIYGINCLYESFPQCRKTSRFITSHRLSTEETQSRS